MGCDKAATSSEHFHFVDEPCAPTNATCTPFDTISDVEATICTIVTPTKREYPQAAVAVHAGSTKAVDGATDRLGRCT